MTKRRRSAHAGALAAIAGFAAACGSDRHGALAPAGGGGGEPPAELASRFPIDGIVDFTGLTTTTATLSFYDGVGWVKDTTLTFAMTNDRTDFYVALEWSDDTFDHDFDWSGAISWDGVALLLDDDGSGTYDDGEDDRALISATAIGSIYADQHRGASGADVCGDGSGKLAYDSARKVWQAEMLFSRFSDAQGEDATLSASTRFNVVLFDSVQPAAGVFHAALLYPSESDSTQWQPLPFTPSLQLPFTPMPGDLGGLIAFASGHEDPDGDLYTFDPKRRIVTHVLSLPGYEDNVSLSHDRQWIAFHASTSYTDFANYEIWKVRVDGSGLTQLTNNSIPDGHPAWSPDDTKIAYASFRDAGPASIVVMTSDGVELADLTPLPWDDNDPEWLPDGRIVFKTDRFGAQPKVKIATMNADGSGVQQVTFDSRSPDSSDHDPVGDATTCLLERFTKGTYYFSDVESLFSPWNIVEARLDGTSERTLVADGWVNYLPVPDPTGRYVAILKNHGYTEVRLLTRAGEDLGRLIPNLTQVRYIDWK